MRVLRVAALMGIGLFMALSARAADEQGLSAGMVHPGYHEQPSWFKQSFLDLREDVAEASAKGKRVMLYFYQDGCPYCAKLLEDNFSQRDIVQTTRKHFDVIAINMWGDREVTRLDGKVTTEKQFAQYRKVMFTPTLLFLDEKGRTVLRLNGYYPPHKFLVALDYVAQKKERQLTFRDYLKHVAPEPATGKLHSEPYYLKTTPPHDLAKAVTYSRKPLLVLFEQKQCPPCDELHTDIMQRKETKKYLGKFDIVQLDMWGKTPIVTPDGKHMTAGQWANKLSIKYAPTMVFFSNKGKEIFRAEAYLKAFHTQSVLDYVSSGAYRDQPSLQRFIEERGDKLRSEGVKVDLWK